MGDHLGALPREPGVVGVEARLDELGVQLVAGEDDRLPEPVATRDPVSARHQHFEHCVDRVDVEQYGVDLVRRDLVGDDAVVVPLGGVPGVLLGLRQVGVGHAACQEFHRHRHRARGHEIALGDGLVEGVGIGGDAVLEPEQGVRVVVDLVLGRGGQPHEQGVEPVEDAAVLRVDRAVRLVDDHEVEVAGAEDEVAVVVPGVDEPHDGGIGRDVDASVGDLVGDQVDGRGRRQVRLERTGGLSHERDAVGEEEHALHPAGVHELLDQGDHRARLARPRRHHQQGPAALERELLAYAADRPLLVVAFDDGPVDRTPGQRQAGRAPPHHEFEFVAGVVALHTAGRVVGCVVPQPGLEPVGVIDDRTATGHDREAVGVQLGLVLARAGVPRGAFGFDHGQRQPVRTPQDVVGEPLPVGARHALHGELADARGVRIPTRLSQVGVDEAHARARLGVVVGVVLHRLGRLDRGDLGTSGLKFGLEVGAGGAHRGDLGVPGLEPREERGEFRCRERWLGACGSGDQGTVESGRQRHRVGGGGVAERRPDHDVEEFFEQAQGSLDADRAALVHRVVARAANERGLHGHLASDDLLER